MGLLHRMRMAVYYRIVERNPVVRQAYQGYVVSNETYHRRHRMRSWWYLVRLNSAARKGRDPRLCPPPILNAADVARNASTALPAGNGGEDIPRVLPVRAGTRDISLVLTARDAGPDSITLDWQAPEGIKCYNIYATGPDQVRRYLRQVTAPPVRCAGLKAASDYTLEVKPSADGTIFSASVFVQARTASGAPTAARGTDLTLRTRSVRYDAVTLEWDSAADFKLYNIYVIGPNNERRFSQQVASCPVSCTRLKASTNYTLEVKPSVDGTIFTKSSYIKVRTADLPATMRFRLPLEFAPYLDGAESASMPRWQPVHMVRQLMQYDVVSFDVFDTLLLRPFARPSDLFMMIGQELDISDFGGLRGEAEKIARQNARASRGNNEVTIHDIYEIVEQKTGVPAEHGIKVEFELELELCAANPYMVEVFELLRNCGNRLIAVSDMYYPEDMLRRLLREKGFEGFEAVYVSCDYNCGKGEGRLFDLVKKDMGRDCRIIHVGDNLAADVNKAREQGLDAMHYQSVSHRGNPYRATGMSTLIGSAYAGVVNSHLHNGTRTYSPYYEYGFLYAGLYVMGFCSWIHDYALHNGLDKILFLSREGDIYSKVYNMLYQDIPWEYLYWSRIPVVQTTLEKNRHPYLLQLVHHKAVSPFPSVLNTVFDRIGIAPLKRYFSAYRLNGKEYLHTGNEKMVEKLLVEHWDEVVDCYRDDSDVRRYLTRAVEGCKNVGVVDVGWSGGNVLSLQYLVEEKYGLDCRVHSLLAAARSISPTYLQTTMLDRQLQCYIFSPVQNTFLHSFHVGTNKNLNSFLFEMLTQSCSSTFLGFEDGRFRFDIPEVENFGRDREIHRGIMEFARIYSRTFKKYPYMMNIPGHDAYMPFMMLVKDLRFVRKFFADFAFGRDLFVTQEEPRMETVREVLEAKDLWQED